MFNITSFVLPRLSCGLSNQLNVNKDVEGGMTKGINVSVLVIGKETNRERWDGLWGIAFEILWKSKGCLQRCVSDESQGQLFDSCESHMDKSEPQTLEPLMSVPMGIIQVYEAQK